MPLPDDLIEPAKAFITYVLNDVGKEYQAHAGDASPLTDPPISAAPSNPSHIRNLRDLHYVWKQFQDGCGTLKRIELLQFKKSFVGEYMEAKCVGERDARLMRLTFSEHDGKIDGCWLTDLPETPTYPPVVYVRTNAQCGRIFKFAERLCSLTLNVRMVEQSDSPRKINCSFNVWIRAHPFYYGAVAAQPHMQDRAGYMWRRVNTDTHLVSITHDRNRYRIEGLQPGTYRVTARIRGSAGSMVSSEIYLDGARQETEVVIPLQWAKSVEIVVDDDLRDRYDVGDLQLCLGGWSWRAWRVHMWDRTMTYWGPQRFEIDRLRYQDGRFRIGKIPAGDYVLGLNPPAECGMFALSKPPKEIALTVRPGRDNKFILTADTIRKFINWNFDMCVDADNEGFHYGSDIEDLIRPSTVALLAYCERREAQDVLYHLVRPSMPIQLRLVAVRALVRHDDVQARILPRIAQLLALVHAKEQPDALAVPCVELLRRADGGVTETSARASEMDMPEDIRRLVIDLGSDFPVLRVHAARQLEVEGRRAAPAIPFLEDAVTDDRYEWPLDDESLIDFERVSDAARRALNAISFLRERR